VISLELFGDYNHRKSGFVCRFFILFSSEALGEEEEGNLSSNIFLVHQAL